MSLNSFVTPEGQEMGRAQVVQALACRLRPDARMNPVLLKPKSDTGSQVIVLGKATGSMNVEQYIRYKSELAPVITQAYDHLAASAQVMILEGAGSPAEVNLKAHDVVNMAMARHARARVLWPEILTGAGYLPRLWVPWKCWKTGSAIWWQAL